MFVGVDAVRPGPAGPVVEFHAEAGAGVAAWHGKPPEAGGRYLVDLDVKGTLDWGETIFTAAPTDPGIAAVGDRVYMSGRLEDYTDDDVAVVRVGPSVVMVKTAGPPAAVGTLVTLSVGTLHLYNVTPTG
jgi:hypothetical protein